MPSRSYYLRQAELLRAMAVATQDLDLRRHQLRRADEYVVLAQSLPDDDIPTHPVPRAATPDQPVAQQQQQIQPDQDPDTPKNKA